MGIMDIATQHVHQEPPATVVKMPIQHQMHAGGLDENCFEDLQHEHMRFLRPVSLMHGSWAYLGIDIAQLDLCCKEQDVKKSCKTFDFPDLHSNDHSIQVQNSVCVKSDARVVVSRD